MKTPPQCLAQSRAIKGDKDHPAYALLNGLSFEGPSAIRGHGCVLGILTISYKMPVEHFLREA